MNEILINKETIH